LVHTVVPFTGAVARQCYDTAGRMSSDESPTFVTSVRRQRTMSNVKCCESDAVDVIVLVIVTVRSVEASLSYIVIP